MSNDIAVVLKAVTNIIFVASSFLFRNKIKELRFAKDELDQTYQRFALLRFMHLSFLIFEYEVVLLKVKMTKFRTMTTKFRIMTAKCSRVSSLQWSLFPECDRFDYNNDTNEVYQAGCTKVSII